jgi:predicted SAM-dependent methyltransferase
MFDVIVMSDVLEHVTDPIKTLNKIFALLKDDGVMLIITPEIGSLSHRLMGKRWSNYKAEHLFYFNRKSIRVLADTAGFDICELRTSKKALNLKYIHSQFQSYPHWFLTPATNVLYSVVPENFCAMPFFVGIGEMMAILRKRR